jgi:hypothetical protein
LHQDHREKYKRLNAKWKSPKKKVEIEARKYELTITSSQSSSNNLTVDKVCESIREKVGRWRRSTSVENQSKIKSSVLEANIKSC